MARHKSPTKQGALDPSIEARFQQAFMTTQGGFEDSHKYAEFVADLVGERLDTKLDGVETRLTAKIDEVDQRLSGRLDRVETELRTLTTTVTALGHGVARLYTITESLEKTMTAGFARIDQRFVKLETRLDTLETRFDKLEARFDTLESRFDKLEARFDTLETKFDALEARFTSLEHRFSSLETLITTRLNPPAG